MDQIQKAIDDYATACETLAYLWHQDVTLRIRYDGDLPPRGRVKRMLDDCLQQMKEECIAQIKAQIEAEHDVDYDDVPCCEL